MATHPLLYLYTTGVAQCCLACDGWLLAHCYGWLLAHWWLVARSLVAGGWLTAGWLLAHCWLVARSLIAGGSLTAGWWLAHCWLVARSLLADCSLFVARWPPLPSALTTACMHAGKPGMLC